LDMVDEWSPELEYLSDSCETEELLVKESKSPTSPRSSPPSSPLASPSYGLLKRSIWWSLVTAQGPTKEIAETNNPDPLI
jgi:hypothetical protein